MSRPDVRATAENYWEGVLRRNPVLATFFGDHRYDDELPDIGPTGRSAESAALGDLQRWAERSLPDDLPRDDRVTRDMLGLSARFGLDAIRFRLDEMAVDQLEGPQVWLLDLMNWHPTDTAEQVDQLISRFHRFPRYMDQYLANLTDGVRERRTAPRVAVERVIGQLRSLLATPPEQSPLAAPAGTTAGRPRHDQLMNAISGAVYPAYQRCLEFLEGAYLREHARAEPGVWAVTDGEAIYATLVAQHTTTELSPRELHTAGLEELASIHAEMRSLMGDLGGSGSEIAAFSRELAARPGNQPSSREQMVQEAELLLENAAAALPRAFGRLPGISCVVKPIETYREKDSVAAFYYPPADDGSRPGIFYVNTFAPESRTRHTLPALVFHEGLPGHHLQIALAQEARELPSFRRLGGGWLTNAYVEGWALYTERLADELQLYPDDASRFGMLGYQAWRACRLVVDTGLHALHWSRQQAIDFLLENVGLTEHETVNEVDRYIVWPGQALAYKVGQREIETLRNETRERLNSRFDLRRFHDEVLAHGPVPLSTLRTLVGNWAG